MSNYKHVARGDTEIHFSEALFSEAENSRMTASPIHYTTLNAGDIVPIYCREVLPFQHTSINLDFVLRQTTLLTPTMSNMMVDYYAFYVPNRVVNQSFKAVMGENYNGSWTGNPVSLAPLKNSSVGSTQIPIGSIADYYGFPTQQPIPNSVLSSMHDLKFRGYVSIYNEYFRDQNYQPPIPISYLNVYQGFLDSENDTIPIGASSALSSSTPPDGSYGVGSVANALYGSSSSAGGSINLLPRKALNSFRAIMKPLKANKLHDYFTSALPSPQKSPSAVLVPVSGTLSAIPVTTSSSLSPSSSVPLQWRSTGSILPVSSRFNLKTETASTGSGLGITTGSPSTESAGNYSLAPANLVTVSGSTVSGLDIDISDIRMAAAIQQVYEALGRGGSRYRSYLANFFGIDVDDPFGDIPKRLGHLRRDLDVYQTAQTSASIEDSTPQGNLAAFGYTANGGELFGDVTFIENGYLHIFAVVRHKNVYSSFLAKDNFRMNMLDFYQPQLCNISEQPIYAYEINPFASSPFNAICYQEAWADYRYEPDYVSGYMRPGIEESLSLWNYADDFDSGLQVIDSNFMKSNSEQVLNRTLAVTSELAPQFKAAFRFYVTKTLPMPVYSVPGMDII